jgi:hypothetical protein
MSQFKPAVLLSVLPLLFFASTNGQTPDDENGSSCIACHTSAVKLINITREMQKAHPPTEKSALTKGEG